MRTITNTTIYKCDHCSKTYQVKKWCDHHEQWCTKNPDNIAKCSGCTYLVEKEKDIYRDGYDGEYTTISKSFFCNKKQIEVYPLKVAKMSLPERYPDYFEGAIQMPKECDDFEFTW